jgi:hypothetical protein
MKNFIFITSILLISCTKTVETKNLPTIAEYSKQVVVMNGVINKILDEKDPKKMYTMAQAVEATRVVDCKPVGEECNSYYKLINKVVNFTKEGSLTDDQRMHLYKMRNDFQTEVQSSELKIRELLKEKINASDKN